MRRRNSLWIALGALAAACSGAWAQTPSADAAKYPEQMVRLVVPFSAGSMTDLLARVVAEKLSERWKQQVIVENRPGLAGTSSVAKATADGYTLMLTSNGHTVIGNLNKNLAFDPLKDFVGVTQVATTPLILVAPPESATKSVKDLIEAAKAKPGALNYSSAGLGSTTGIAAELFKQTTRHRYRASCLPRSARIADRRHPRRRGHGLHVLQRRRRSRPGRQDARAGRDRRQAPRRPARRADLQGGRPAGVRYDAWFGILAPAGHAEADRRQGQQAVAASCSCPTSRRASSRKAWSSSRRRPTRSMR